MSTDLVVARLDAARVALSEARTIQDTKKILDMAAAAEIYAKRQQLSEENIAFAIEVRIEALRQLGEFLKVAPKNSGDLLRGSKSEPRENPPTLAEQGIDKKTSMVAQRIADLPPKVFEAVKTGKVSVAKATAAPKKAAVAVAKGQAPKAKAQTEKERIAEEAFGDVDVLDEMEQSIRERDAKIAALEADDTKAELARQINIAQHYQREIGMEQDKNARLMKERDEAWKWRNRVCEAVGEAHPTKALAAIRTAFAKAVA